MPGNVRRLQNSFSKVVKQMIPFIKLTSTDPEKYLYEINSKTGDMEPSKKAINIVKRIMKKGYSGDRLDFTKKIAHIPNVIYELPPKEIMPHQMFVFSYYLVKRQTNVTILL